jgi:L-alanine-DL-glutamate epimerase-like enolase superfamily enzyme
MGQVHVHLSFWHPATSSFEYIPWIRSCFEEPVTVTNGDVVRPEQPGAGTAIRPEAFDTHAKSLD